VLVDEEETGRENTPKRRPHKEEWNIPSAGGTKKAGEGQFWQFWWGGPSKDQIVIGIEQGG